LDGFVVLGFERPGKCVWLECHGLKLLLTS
jgi:hypothetical protein